VKSIKKYKTRIGQKTGTSNMENREQTSAITVARVADNLNEEFVSIDNFCSQGSLTRNSIQASGERMVGIHRLWLKLVEGSNLLPQPRFHHPVSLLPVRGRISVEGMPTKD
jgi:hypothetical protein